MEEIIKDKIRADHLLYVGLKYTKTCDVCVNSLLRWKEMSGLSLDHLLKHAKKKKKISSVPTNPVGKLETAKKVFKKDKNFLEGLNVFKGEVTYKAVADTFGYKFTSASQAI